MTDLCSRVHVALLQLKRKVDKLRHGKIHSSVVIRKNTHLSSSAMVLSDNNDYFAPTITKNREMEFSRI